MEARIEEVGRQIAEAQVKSLVHSIASGLEFLHGRGIAHRDIKPANILLPDPLSVRFISCHFADFKLNYINSWTAPNCAILTWRRVRKRPMRSAATSRKQTLNRNLFEINNDFSMTSPVGSAEFMAPEVVRAFCAMDDERVKYDQKCDMWSLGVIT